MSLAAADRPQWHEGWKGAGTATSQILAPTKRVWPQYCFVQDSDKSEACPQTAVQPGRINPGLPSFAIAASFHASDHSQALGSLGGEQISEGGPL